MEAIPGADALATAISQLTHAWDREIQARGRSSERGSAAWVDEHEPHDELGMPIRLTSLPAALAFYTGSSVIQVARSIAALLDTSDRWGLTLGHLPLLRSVLEGVGQVRYLILGKDPLDGDPELDRDGVPRNFPIERIERSALLWAKCLQQAWYDFGAQGAVDAQADVNTALDEWESFTGAWLQATVKRNANGLRHWDVWTIGPDPWPGFGDIAEWGAGLAIWSHAPVESEDSNDSDKRDGVDAHEDDVDTSGRVYPWLSAACHHRLYPLIATLTADKVDGQPVHRVAPDPVEVSAAGSLAAHALLRMIDLTFNYTGWPHDGLQEPAHLLNSVVELIDAPTNEID